MIITIITGGSGSENIQKGLYNISPHLKLNLIINGYDDGKSTGVLRNLFPGTLGISDFRKNQILEYKLINGNTQLYNLLNHRFTNDDPYNSIVELIQNIEMPISLKTFLIDNVDYFFTIPNVNEIEYTDFSFMNIIYCSLLHKNKNDMEIVCNIIKTELGLKNNIYLNSPDVLILKGITKNKNILSNEDSIVSFNDHTDKLVDIYFSPNKIPTLNKNTEEIIMKSDIILFSCGTQFSSLIPTYKTILFKESVQAAKASKYLVLNADYDNDIINYTGNELLYKINEYLPLDNIKIIISTDTMNTHLIPTANEFKYLNILKLIQNKKHNGKLLWKYILVDYFQYYFNETYIFDYDYTLFDKDFIHISNENLKLIEKIKNKMIVTNNCLSNLIPIKDTIIYSNIGNIYNYNGNFEIIHPEYMLNAHEIDDIQKNTEFLFTDISYSIVNRKNMTLSIKPIYNRNEVIDKINAKFIDKNIHAIATGKTTIEILKKGLSKRNVFIKKNFMLKGEYTYITDDNDINYDSSIDKLKYLQIPNIETTHLFLKTLIMNEKYDFCIIVGGINKRMQIDFPKCLIMVDNEYVLLKLITQIFPYANKIFICGNNYYKPHFIKFEENITIQYKDKIKFLYFHSIDNEYDYPKGNGETIYQLLQNEILTEKIFIMWGDFLLSNHAIFEEIYNYSFDTDFDMIIPTIYEKNPYAYLIIDNNNKVEYMEYKKNIDISYGYHDQCIFLCNTQKIKENMNPIINNKQQDEKNFLDIIKYLNKVFYYETLYYVKSFNTKSEINV